MDKISSSHSQSIKVKLTVSAIFLALTLLMACSNDPKSTQEPAVIDSAKIKDSLSRTAIKKEDQHKVLGNIVFGISEQQFETDLDKFKNTLEHNEFKTSFVIGDYIFSDIEGSFDNNKLYKLTTSGDFIPYERYKEELLPQVEILKALIFKSYGKPHAGTGAPASQNTDKGYSYLAYSWNIGSKTIEIRVTNRDLYYSADLKIYQPAIEDLIVKREADQKTRSAEKVKDVL
jgi:hypothetical protein